MRLIDADRALEIVRDQGIAHPNAYHLANYATLILREAPTIEAEPVRHGYWEKRGQEIYCSECGEESGYTWAGASRYSDYCPHCGAKLDLEG